MSHPLIFLNFLYKPYYIPINHYLFIRIIVDYIYPKQKYYLCDTYT